MIFSIIVYYCIAYPSFKVKENSVQPSGPSCSKLMTSLVNDSLKFISSDTQIC